MLGKALAIAFVILLAVSGVQGFLFYSTVIYPADIGKEWVSRAIATNDLLDMSKYLINALQALEPYHGNPGWPFPTPDSSYDQIKINIQEVVKNCQIWTNQTGTSFAYQQAVHNLVDTLTQIHVHLMIANMDLWMNPTFNPIGWIIDGPWIVLIVICLILLIRELA